MRRVADDMELKSNLEGSSDLLLYCFVVHRVPILMGFPLTGSENFMSCLPEKISKR